MTCFLRSNIIWTTRLKKCGLWTTVAYLLLFVLPSGSCQMASLADASTGTFVAEGAAWHCSVMEENKVNEMLHNLSEPLSQFAPLAAGMRYLFVQIDSIEFDAAVTDPISLWRDLDASHLVFHLGDEEYKSNLAIEYGTDAVFCFALIVPETTPNGAPLTVTAH